MEKLNDKINDLSIILGDSNENTLKNFYIFYDKIKDNNNMKKLIKSRNNLIFNNIDFWKLKEYTDNLWTTLQLCFLLNELNQDDKDNKFISSLIRSLEKNEDIDNNNDIDEDVDKINDLVNNIDKDQINNLLKKFNLDNFIEKDNVNNIMDNLKNLNLNKKLEKKKVNIISDILDDFILMFNTSDIKSLQDLEILCKPLIEKHKDMNLTHEELIIGVLKNKQKIKKIKMDKLLSMALKLNNTGLFNNFNTLDIMKLVNKI